MSVLQVANASFSYERQSEKIFEDISFEVGQGEIFCLLGPNGCGKSTLLDNILGVNHLQQGEIRVMGRDTRTLKAGQIARYIAYVPQSHERTFPYQILLKWVEQHIPVVSPPPRQKIKKLPKRRLTWSA